MANGNVLAPMLNLQGQLISAIGQKQQNKKTREWSEKMYNLQREHALADWNMMNEYNSPANQMARLKAAGLNPQLALKNGAGADAPPVRTSSVESWNPSPPTLNMGGLLTEFQNMELREAQIDNAKTSNALMQLDGILKVLGIEGKGISNEAGRFDLGVKQDLRETTVEAAKAALNKLMVDTQVTLNQDERNAAMNATSIYKAMEEIYTMRKARAKTDAEINHINQQIRNLKKDETLKQLDIDLRKMGIMPGDPMWARIVGRLINGAPGVLESKTINSVNSTIFSGANQIKKLVNQKRR